ncbi:hypothetical protein PENTCL1PPCAC_14079, partial [Pristionchus entomophagus]
GSIILLINGLLCCLIVLDRDVRGKSYRKYLFSLQFFSTVADLVMHGYFYFMQANCRVAYSDSFLASFADVLTGIIIYIFLIFQIGISYFICVFYRRKMILPPGSLFCFNGWKYLALYITQNIMSIIAL